MVNKGFFLPSKSLYITVTKEYKRFKKIDGTFGTFIGEQDDDERPTGLIRAIFENGDIYEGSMNMNG